MEFVGLIGLAMVLGEFWVEMFKAVNPGSGIDTSASSSALTTGGADLSMSIKAIE